MFVQDISTHQQAIFLHLLHKLVQADEHVSATEEGKMAFFQKAFPGVSAEEAAASDLPSLFPDRKSRVGVMLELFSVAMADGAMNSADASFMNQLGTQLQFSASDMDGMIQWVTAILDLLRQVQIFMED